MPMNPLHMNGLQFLVFYLIFSGLALFLLRFRIKQQESKWPVPKLNFTDPYEIAFLRGGENEALRIAALSLIDRGLLEVSENTLRTKNKSALDHARRPIEKALLENFMTPSEADKMYNDNSLLVACTEYRTLLRQLRLIANDSVYESRRPMLCLGLIILGGLAGAKLYVAFQNGRYNVLFLLLLAGFAMSYLFKFYSAERTGLGDRVLTDLRVLFEGLKERGFSIKPGGETNEAALVAAVFGVSALSSTNFPYIEKLFPKAAKNNGALTAGTCGSSCGSSCGGSCGGGGCGGCGGD